MRRLLYPGSFDPATRGHLDIIRRASALCDELIVAVMHNPDKRGALDVPTRVRVLETACAPYANVRVVTHGGLLVECARDCGVTAVVRGVRPLGDFEAEYQMAQVNRMLGGVETLLMTTSEELASISSSIVRQIAAFGGEIESLVPPGTCGIIKQALRRGEG
ncbi:MAG: pantetheine-phosphate adenylyltransferase [Candidatus Ventricola sp.]